MIRFQNMGLEYRRSLQLLNSSIFKKILTELAAYPNVTINLATVASLDASENHEILLVERPSWPVILEHRYKIGPLLSYKDAPLHMSLGYVAASVNLYFPKINGYEKYYNSVYEEGRYLDYAVLRGVARDTKIQAVPDTLDLCAKLEPAYKRWQAKRKRLREDYDQLTAEVIKENNEIRARAKRI